MMKNNLLSEQLTYAGVSPTPTHLHLCSYNAEGISRRDAEKMDDLLPFLDRNAITWIQIHGFRNTEALRGVCQYFHIDFLTIQDILNPDHQTKIEQHDAYNVVILKLLASDGTACLPQQMAIVQGNGFLLTFIERETDFLNDIYGALEKNVLKIRNRQSDFLLSVILNSVMSSFISIISGLEDGLEDLEERLLSPDRTDVPGIEDIQQYRRRFRVIKRCIFPLKEEIGKLLHTADGELLHKANRLFFNDVNDHLQFVLQTLDGCRDMISALVEIYLSNNDQRMNSIMKQLTVVSTVFIPLTCLAGIWGMNFRWMPELEWQYGYFFAWGLMLVLVAVIYFFFKHKKWY
ncbi:MAG: magnesium/cobalt transporter CorA [Phocaeicola sp.]|nr:magnesium/cobalt transporter CorA [Phocaeicola sp.]